MSILYIFLLLCGLGLCTFLIAKAVASDGLRALVTSPLSLFSVYFGLIHFLTPAIKHISGFYRYQANYGESTFIYVGMMTVGVYIACWFLLRELQYRFPAEIEVGPSYDRLFSVLAFAITLFVLGAIASYQDYRTITQNVGMDSFLSDRHEAASERGIARVLSNLMVVGFTIFVSAVASDRFNLSRVIILMGMLAVCMYYYGLISSRNSILILILFGTLSFLLNSRSIRFAALQINKIGMLGMLVFATLFVMYFITIERYSVSDSSAAQDRLSNAALYAIDGAFGNDEALLWLWENEFPLHMGETYLAAATNVIPRSLWADKPFGGGPVLINMIFPGSYEIGAKGNNSLTTGFLTEAVMNFGFAGSPLIVVAWVLLVHFVMRQLAESSCIYWRSIFLIVWVTLCSGFMHMEFLGYVVKLGMFIAPILVGVLIMPRSKMLIEDEDTMEGTYDDNQDEDLLDEDLVNGNLDYDEQNEGDIGDDCEDEDEQDDYLDDDEWGDEDLEDDDEDWDKEDEEELEDDEDAEDEEYLPRSKRITKNHRSDSSED